MSLRHILAITRKEFNHILRDRSTLILVVFTPLAMLLLMAYALTVELQHIPIAVLDYDRSATSRDFVQRIVSGNDLDLYAQVGSIAEIESLLIHGKVKAALVIDPNFSRDLLAMRGMPMQVIIDGTEPESGGFAVEHIASRAQEFANMALSTQIQMMGFSADALNPLDLRIRTWYNPGLKPRNDLIPGLISMVLGMPALSVALALAHEREHGTMEQLMATPIGRGELLVGKMIPYIVAGLVNVIILPLLAMSWFNVPFNGSFPLFFALSALFMFAVLSMGIIIGVFMKTQAAAMGVSFLMIFFPGFFLTGIFFPIVSMPEIMRLESLGMPGTHYATITRGIFLPGVGMEILWPYAIMLIILGFSFTGIAALFFRKKLG
ncbi:MAG: ABC transporter permease [Anaerolineae bacterium]|jgi:ABC-2 type transport system permease protein|nr:ABC transporter permease [Anaerolineae bacterium]MBT4309979.1 ABC transporter permease [Anaerolineae bacterium]MBT4457045.1 ABC transporter permease [Anaerolineae bacterium]MBT6059722.1 ABC transporter permease [Anaerolineae bacterium]MBT6324059.1 ABC transporter permease [Anaerolineae bacterium]